MTIAEILSAQLFDPFRIGLLVALLFTARNTAAQMGNLIPILLGLVFVAVLLPTAFGSGAAEKTTAITVGLLSNGIIVAVLLGLWTVFNRLRGGSKS